MTKGPIIMIVSLRIMTKGLNITVKVPNIMANAPNIMITVLHIMTNAPNVMITDHLRQPWGSIAYTTIYNERVRNSFWNSAVLF